MLKRGSRPRKFCAHFHNCTTELCEPAQKNNVNVHHRLTECNHICFSAAKCSPVIKNTIDLQSHKMKVFLWGMILTAGGTWGNGVGVLKRCDRGHPMRLLQSRVTMATVSLLHSAERFLPVDTPKTHGAEGRAETRRGVQREGNAAEEEHAKAAGRWCSRLTRRLLPLSCAPRL